MKKKKLLYRTRIARQPKFKSNIVSLSAHSSKLNNKEVILLYKISTNNRAFQIASRWRFTNGESVVYLNGSIDTNYFPAGNYEVIVEILEDGLSFTPPRCVSNKVKFGIDSAIDDIGTIPNEIITSTFRDIEAMVNQGV
ncbi:hypothetical protein HY045_01050 [Candidatus Woesebacteria bacterium]|nr:hypothetical protein [Candidatus Woesebacteria bacterium]